MSDERRRAESAARPARGGGAHDAAVTEFGERVRAARARLVPRQAHSPTAGEREVELLVEELTVAEEELHHQLDEISDTRDRLELERQRYVELFELAPDPYFVTDVAGRVSEANRAATQLAGRSSAQLVGTLLVNLVDRPARAELRRVLRQLTRADDEPAPLHVALAMRPRSGVVLDVAATIAPIWRYGRSAGLRILMRDVSSSRAVERENERLRSHLESAVAERTVEMEDALATAIALRDAAERASRRKSDFLAFLSHEVRTPMQAVIGYSEMLLMGLRGPLTAPQRLDVERMQRGQQHIVRLLNQLLDYSRIESGAVDLTSTVVHLDALLDSTIDLLRPLAEASSVRFVRQGASVSVRADAEKTRQILINVLSNAIKFGRPGGAVTVDVHRSRGEGEVRITDEGPGVPPEARELVFEPFVHLQRGTEGTGLGLPISRQLARAMGGELVLEAGEGPGATFVVRLPLP
jgi:PAS domain S-box-containing protein